MSLLVQKVLLFLMVVNPYAVSYAALEPYHDTCCKSSGDGRYWTTCFQLRLNMLLSEAVIRGDMSEAQALVAKGACVNSYINVSGYRSYKPIHSAARRGNSAAINFCLENNAYMYALTHDGNTAFHYAATQGHHEGLYMLLQHECELFVGGLISEKATVGEFNQCQQIQSITECLAPLPIDIIKIIAHYKGLEKYPISITHKNAKQETLLESACMRLANEADTKKQDSLIKCIAFLKEYPSTIMNRFLRFALRLVVS
ncbi:MAG: ankyrin repeat domain-containing protein [Candidatus Dependentiae bacterium]|nr:ankyrin repeat domain-containing protein [Candidatus Dependentiae bacterium]